MSNYIHYSLPTATGVSPYTGLLQRAASTGGIDFSKVCQAEQQQEFFGSWELKDDPASACSKYVVSLDNSFTVSVPCSASECIDELKSLAGTLPNCSLSGGELTASGFVKRIVDECKDGKNDFPRGEPVESPVSTPLCSTEQIKQTEEAFVEASKLEECKDNVIAWGPVVSITSTCNSTCTVAATKLFNASLPDCYYEFDAENKRQAVDTANLDCVDSSGSDDVFISFRSDSQSNSTSSVDASETESPATTDATKAPDSGATSGALTRTIVTWLFVAAVIVVC